MISIQMCFCEKVLIQNEVQNLSAFLEKVCNPLNHSMAMVNPAWVNLSKSKETTSTRTILHKN